MKRNLTLLVVMLFFSSFMHAQTDYRTAVGARIGAYSYYNASLKHFITDQAAVEVIVGLGGFSSIGGGLLYQHHFQLDQIDVPGFNVYVGGGGLTGVRFYPNIPNDFNLAGFIGAGLDYKFQDLPLNASFDIYPGIQILPNIRITGFGGLSLRYVIGE